MTVRLCTWNIWLNHGPWEDRYQAISRALATINADVIAFQEVYDPPEGSRIHDIAADLELEVVMGPPPKGFDAPVRNALLSRWPVLETDSLLLASDNDKKFRSVVMARIDAPDGPISVFTTHLEHRYHRGDLRLRQLEEIVAFIDSHWPDEDEFPPILLGDLNAVPDSDELRRVTGKSTPFGERVFLDAWNAAPHGELGITWDASNPYLAEVFPQWPNRRLDYILVGYPSNKPLGRVANIELAGNEPVDGVMPSDHFALVADLYTASDTKSEDS